MLLFCGSSLIAWAQQDVAPQPGVVAQIRVIGNRRIPRETVLARLFTHPGDTYDPATIERDFNSLWNTGYFENLQIAREDTPKGIVLDIIVKEKPTIREINYKGLNSVSTSDVLDRFKKEHVTGFSVESPYDPTRLARAIDVIRELLAEHGHQFATVKPEIKTIPPSSVSVNFIIKEGPTVKVGNISFTGNRAVSSRELRASMRNLRPVGIPHSIFLENLFARTYDASKLEEDTERVRRALQDRGYFRAEVGDPITHIRNEGGLSFFTFRPARVSASTSAFPSRRVRATGLAVSPSPATRMCRTSRRCALSSPPKTVNCSMPPPSARDWIIYARLTVRWATSTSPPCRRRASMTPNTWSTWTSTSTRARLLPSRASSSRATPSPAIG